MFRMFGVAAYNDPVIYLLRELRERHKLDPADIAEAAVTMNWHETMYPSVVNPAHPEWNRPRVGSTHYYAAHVLVNGSYPVVGGATFGPTGRNLAEDDRVLEFMNAHVTLVQDQERAMFSPRAAIRMKSGATHTADYPYERLQWSFEQLVERLQECLPGYSGGKTAFDALAETMRGAERLASVERIFQIVKA